MDRDVTKTTDFESAREADLAQQRALSVDERLAAARELKRRVYGNDNPDVREAERGR